MKKFFASAFWQNFGIALLMLLVAIGLFIGTSIMSRSWDKELAQLDSDINDASVSQSGVIGQDMTNRAPEVDVTPTGYDGNRKLVDDALAADVFGLRRPMRHNVIIWSRSMSFWMKTPNFCKSSFHQWTVFS